VLHCLDLRLNECGCTTNTPELLKEIKTHNEQSQGHSAQELHDDKRY
jgi:hypothetical protein